MHLDGEVIASGWQTVCVWMRMYVEQVLNHAAMLAAPGVEEVRWLRPVKPGMRLNGRTTILESRPSKRTPERGSRPAARRVARRRGGGRDVGGGTRPRLAAERREDAAA